MIFLGKRLHIVDLLWINRNIPHIAIPMVAFVSLENDSGD